MATASKIMFTNKVISVPVICPETEQLIFSIQLETDEVNSSSTKLETAKNVKSTFAVNQVKQIKSE